MLKSLSKSSMANVSLAVTISCAAFLLAGSPAANSAIDAAGAPRMVIHEAAMDCDPTAQVCTDGVHRGVVIADLDCDPTSQICTGGVHRG